MYELFESYCSSEPKTKDRLPDKRTGNIYTRITFQTYSLPCFNEFHNLFYPAGFKTVPSNIGDLLTPAGLAYLIQDDGNFSKSHGTVSISTNSFSESEVDSLISVLTNKFELACRKERSGADFKIVIKKCSVVKLREIVSPYFHITMLYKLGL